MCVCVCFSFYVRTVLVTLCSLRHRPANQPNIYTHSHARTAEHIHWRIGCVRLSVCAPLLAAVQANSIFWVKTNENKIQTRFPLPRSNRAHITIHHTYMYLTSIAFYRRERISGWTFTARNDGSCRIYASACVFVFEFVWEHRYLSQLRRCLRSGFTAGHACMGQQMKRHFALVCTRPIFK